MVIPNIMVIPPFIFKAISTLEMPTFKAALVKVKNELAKLDRIEARKNAPDEGEGVEEAAADSNTSESEKYILVLQ